MDELFNMIKNLPTLTLSSQEWNIFDEIVSELKEKSVDEFKRTWAEFLNQYKEPFITSCSLEKLCAYLEVWFAMTKRLTQIHEALAVFWLKTHKKPIIADELLDFTVELLPKNIYLLRLTIKAIEQAAYLDSKNQIGFSLTILHSAVYVKAEQLEFNKCKLEPPDYAEKIVKTAMRFRQKQIVAQLNKRCEEYLSYICKRVADLLKENDELGYKFYYKQNDTGDLVKNVAIIIADIEDNNSVIANKKLIQVYLKKYILLQDFLFTLTRKNNSYQDKFIEFSEKYTDFMNYIRTNSDNNTGFSIKAVSEFFGGYNPFRITKEEEFLKKAQELIEKGKQFVNINAPPSPCPLPQ